MSAQSMTAKQFFLRIFPRHSWPAGLAAALLLLSTCGREERISYNEHIRPIFNDQCLACHGGVKQLGGFSLLFREEAMDTTESGVYAIVPGDRHASELYRRLRHEDPEMRMPLDAEPLSDEQIELIGRWIDQGAAWEEHWAYIAPEAPAPPAVDNDWIRSDIDRYVYRRLEREGLAPAPAADPVALLRRVSLDLTGLPPTEEALTLFLNDEQPGAYERAVDRLLAFPHYGERWAGMWLDLARYADSKGYEKDSPRAIWRYRDWVIDAFNRDLPFDQFTIEQLAGDLLPEPSREQLLATAFHRNTMTNTEGGTDDEEFRVAAVIDRVNTTFEVWQATTISCVQCHSHPYDPFRQEDYYRLYAFFNNSVDSDNDPDLPLLECYEPAAEAEIKAIVDYIRDLAPARPVDTTARLSEQVQQALFPTLYVQDADDFENVVFYGRQIVANWNNGVRSKAGKRFSIQFNDIDTEGLEAVTLHYRAGGPEGRFVVRLDDTDGPVIAEAAAPATPSNNQYIDYRLAVAPTPGRHDLLVELDNETGRVPEGTLFLKWVRLHYAGEREPPALAARRNELGELRRLRADYTPVLREKSAALRRSTHVFERGNWLVKGAAVDPGIPAVLPPPPADAPADRLGLASWLVSPGNPLTARVMVNRYWAELFGTGLVETVEDLGTQGEAPSHPGLLDMLAWRYARDYNWSSKRLLREIVLSATYRQSSQLTPQKQERDPYNRLLARGPRYRLGAEQIRDQALAISGLLDETIGGPSVMPPQPEGVWQVIYSGARWETKADDRYRRGLYTYWKRTTPYPSMIAFDSPSREFCVSRRIRTNTPLQALVTLNDPVYVEAAQALARRMRAAGGQDVEACIQAGYRRALLRDPAPATMEVLLDLYAESRDALQPAGARTIADPPPTESGAAVDDPMTLVANAILNLDAVLTKN